MCVHAQETGLQLGMKPNTAVKTKVQRPYSGIRNAISTILREEGVMGLYRGLGATVLVVGGGKMPFGLVYPWGLLHLGAFNAPIQALGCLKCFHLRNPNSVPSITPSAVGHEHFLHLNLSSLLNADPPPFSFIRPHPTFGSAMHLITAACHPFLIRPPHASHHLHRSMPFSPCPPHHASNHPSFPYMVL